MKQVDAMGLRGRTAEGRDVVLFSSNDYLGLSAHPSVLAATHEAVDKWGAGAGASRLLAGSRPVHHELETRLAKWKTSEGALVFGSGYAANVGVLSALAGPQVLICSDELNHASIVDGCRLATALGATVRTFRHCDVEGAAELVGPWEGRCILVTDAVFSMDGDVAPVAQLAEVCGRHGALLVLDEAHSVLGPEPGALPCEVLRVGTLSKTLGSQGGFVAGPRATVELLVNRCRPFIYSTALAPPAAAAALAALDVLQSAEGVQLRSRLQSYCYRLLPERPVATPIIPVVTGDEEAALDAAEALAEMGLFVPAVRPPTGPPGTSRLRVSLSAAHTEDEIGLLLKALGQLGFLPTLPTLSGAH